MAIKFWARGSLTKVRGIINVYKKNLLKKSLTFFLATSELVRLCKTAQGQGRFESNILKNRILIVLFQLLWGASYDKESSVNLVSRMERFSILCYLLNIVMFGLKFPEFQPTPAMTI